MVKVKKYRLLNIYFLHIPQKHTHIARAAGRPLCARADMESKSRMLCGFKNVCIIISSLSHI